MKSEFGDRDTLGTMLYNTHKEHGGSSPVQAGDLTNEISKSYNKALNETIEKHRDWADEYYIQVIPKKEMYAPTRTIYFRFFARKTEPLLEDDMDVWYINNKTGKSQLHWSLPHWSEMDMFLINKHKYDPKFIHWIEKYKEQEEARKASTQQ